MMVSVTPEKALIFRIAHRDNVALILDCGLECANGADPAAYRNIGDLDLIAKRRRPFVPVPPCGTLGDYVPFYFTYASIMLFNIRTGHGVPSRPNEDIVFLVTSLHKLKEVGVQFVFTDRHAYLNAAEFFADLNSLDRIDWDILQRRDYKHDPEDLEKKERYMAEALVYGRVPLNGLLGFACYNVQVEEELKLALADREIQLPVYVKPTWYFR